MSADHPTTDEAPAEVDLAAAYERWVEKQPWFRDIDWRDLHGFEGDDT